MCSRFIAGEWRHILQDKRSCVQPRSRAEMLEYGHGQVILLCLVVEHIAKREDRGGFHIVIMTRRLWIKEILDFFFENQNMSARSNLRIAEKDKPRIFTRQDSSASGMFSI